MTLESVKAERTDFGHFCIFIGPNVTPLEVWPQCEATLMHNTIVKMFLLDLWAWGAGCMNDYVGFLITVLYSICNCIIDSDMSEGKYIR